TRSIAPLRRLFAHHTAPSATPTLSLHDALPISLRRKPRSGIRQGCLYCSAVPPERASRCRSHCSHAPGGSNSSRTPPSRRGRGRSEEHTSELQSLTNLVCRLLLEKKKHTPTRIH